MPDAPESVACGGLHFERPGDQNELQNLSFHIVACISFSDHFHLKHLKFILLINVEFGLDLGSNRFKFNEGMN